MIQHQMIYKTLNITQCHYLFLKLSQNAKVVCGKTKYIVTASTGIERVRSSQVLIIKWT